MAAMSAFFVLASTLSACGTFEGEEFIPPVPPENKAPYVLKTPRRVNFVFDGDTIEVNVEGLAERVRFKGLDTPELRPNPPGSPAEPFAEAAKTYTFEHIGTEVDLEFDSDCDTDPFTLCRDSTPSARLLAYIRVSNGDDLGARLIEAGLGRAFAFQNEPYDRRQQYEALEAQAQAAGVGMWQ